MYVLDFRTQEIREVENFKDYIYLAPEMWVEVVENGELDNAFKYTYELNNGTHKRVDWIFKNIDIGPIGFTEARRLFLEVHGLKIEDVSLINKVLYLSNEHIKMSLVKDN